MAVTMETLPELKLFGGWVDRNRIVSQFIRTKFASYDRPITVLEAGCGRKWSLDLRPLQIKITGIDVDKDAIETRLRSGDLSAAVIGDLRTTDFKPNTFDCVYSCDVLEHIAGVEVVMRRLFRWLRPGGVAILIFPDRTSLFALLTKLTPFWMHIAYHKYLHGLSEAGTPGFGPYRTYHDKILCRRGIHAFCANHGYRVALEYGRRIAIRDWPYNIGHLYRIVAWVAAKLSRGKIAASHVGLVYAIEKP